MKLDILHYISDPENWEGFGDNQCRYFFTLFKKTILDLQKYLTFLLQLWHPASIPVNFLHPFEVEIFQCKWVSVDFAYSDAWMYGILQNTEEGRAYISVSELCCSKSYTLITLIKLLSDQHRKNVSLSGGQIIPEWSGLHLVSISSGVFFSKSLAQISSQDMELWSFLTVLALASDTLSTLHW